MILLDEAMKAISRRVVRPRRQRAERELGILAGRGGAGDGRGGLQVGAGAGVRAFGAKAYCRRRGEGAGRSGRAEGLQEGAPAMGM